MNLKQVMEVAHAGALICMEQHGSCNPVALIVKDGRVYGIEHSGGFGSVQQKDEFAERIREHTSGATALVMVMESWVLIGAEDCVNDGKLCPLPSQSPNRQEAVVLAGEDASQTVHKHLLVVRGEKGRFVRFEDGPEFTIPKGHETEGIGAVGRFANLIKAEA